VSNRPKGKPEQDEDVALGQVDYAAARKALGVTGEGNVGG